MVVDLYMVYSFLKRLATPFNKWEAYDLGIIDERGNILRKRKELRKNKERKAFSVFDVMVLNMKKLIEKVPGGKSRIASYAAALYLIREWNHMTDSESMLTEDITDEQIHESLFVFHDRYINYNILSENVNSKVDINELFEENFSSELNELFDKSYPYKLDIREKSARANIVLRDRTKLVVRFTKKKYGIWDLIFERGGSIDITDKGDQYKVFATVIAVIREFIQKAEPRIISFEADKLETNSRSSLYGKMLDRFAKTIGYHFNSKEEYGVTRYLLMKEEAPTVNVGGGQVAGLGVGDQGEPGLTPSQMKRYKKKNKGLKKLRDVIGKAR